MSIIKDIIAKKEMKRHNQLEGYKKKLISEGTYNMPCPYCEGPLSDSDVKKEQCIHCGYVFKW